MDMRVNKDVAHSLAIDALYAPGDPTVCESTRDATGLVDCPVDDRARRDTVPLEALCLEAE